MTKNKLVFFSVGVLSLAVLITAGNVLGQTRSGTWTPPTSQFPQGNTSPPVDVSQQPQTKFGPLTARYFISSETGVRAAFLMPPGTFIGTNPDGNNKIFLSAGTNMVISAGGGFLVLAPGGPASFQYSKGLVLPNVAPSALGTTGGEGMLTYSGGKLWLLTPSGGIPGGEGQTLKESLMQKLGLSVEKTTAQTQQFQWVQVGGANTYWALNTSGKIYYSPSNVGVGVGTNAPRGPIDVVSGADNKPAYFSGAKGLVLPTFTTAILGTNVPVGTITYDNGDIWLYTGGNNCQQGSSFIPSASAQSGRCWVKVGGTVGGSQTYNLANFFKKASNAVIYNDLATSSGVAIGNDNPNYLGSAGGMLFGIGKPQGTTEPINFHIGGDQVITDNAYYNNGWQFNVGGDNKRATAIEIGSGRINFKVSANESGNQQSNNGLLNKATAQTGGPVQWVDALYIEPVNGKVTVRTLLTAKNNIVLAPDNTAQYKIQNSYGTLNFVANNMVPRLSLGQDGALILNGVLKSSANQITYLGSVSENNATGYAPTNELRCLFLNQSDCSGISKINIYPNAPRCGCSNSGQGSGTPIVDGCLNSSQGSNMPIGTICSSFFHSPSVGGGQEGSIGKPMAKIGGGISSLFNKVKAEETYGFLRYYRVVSTNMATLKIGGRLNPNSNIVRGGVVALMGSAQNLGQDSGIALEGSGGQTPSGALFIRDYTNGNMSETKYLAINPTTLRDTCNTTNNKYLAVDNTGAFVCRELPAVSTPSLSQEYEASCGSNPCSKDTQMGSQSFCFLTMVVDDVSRGRCRIDGGPSNWILHVDTWQGDPGGFYCRARCVKF